MSSVQTDEKSTLEYRVSAGSGLAWQHEDEVFVILDMPDVASAHALWAADPRNAAGLYGETEVLRFRFGRVFDRFG